MHLDLPPFRLEFDLIYTDICNIGINRSTSCNTSFWLDKWYGDYALYCVYPNLFKIVSDSTIIVASAFANNNLSLQFNRQLIGILISEWQNLQSNIGFNSLTLITNHRTLLHGEGLLMPFYWGDDIKTTTKFINTT